MANLSGRETSEPITVVCCGDSITYGQISDNYVELLSEHMGLCAFHFINAGVNNDLTYNLLLRLDDVIAHQPRIVTVLIGTNDILATLSRQKSQAYRMVKHLPRQPDLDWSLANLTEIVRRLKKETSALVGLASIPVLGEDLNDLPNLDVKAYNSGVKAMAAEEGVGYLPIFERQVEYLMANSDSPTGRPLGNHTLLTVELLASRLITGESFASFSYRKGYKLLTDGVHMGPQGAALIASEIREYLEKVSNQVGEAELTW